MFIGPRFAALASLLLAVACFDDKGGDTGDEAGDDGPSQCGSTQGFVHGLISGSDVPTLVAESSDGDEVRADWYGDPTDAGVPYELNVEAGSWVITVSAPECSTKSAAVEVEACIEYGVNVDLDCG